MGRRLHCKTARFLWEKGSPKPWKKRYKYPYESQMKRRNSPINVKLRWESKKAHGFEKKPFKKFMRLPKELQLKIWNNALSKPGIHFFAVVVTPPDKEWNPMDPHAWKPPFILTDWPCEVREVRIPHEFETLVRMMRGRGTEEGGIPMREPQPKDRGNGIEIFPPEIAGNPVFGPVTRWNTYEHDDGQWVPTPPERGISEEAKQTCGLIRLVEPEEGRPSGSFLTAGQSFPPGCVSAYKTYDSLKQVSSSSEAVALKSTQEFDERLDISLGNGKQASIDAAHDLVYVKFLEWYNLPNSSFGQTPMYSRSPSLYHHQREYHSLSGIRRVAVEIEEGWTQRCMRPQVLRRAGACYCRASRSCHSPAYEAALKRLVSFLWCFPDLEYVYLVFHSTSQWDLRKGARRRYTTFGPMGRLDFTTSNRKYKWVKREGDTFYCPGGTLREPSKPLDRLCMLVDNVHWHYHHLDAAGHTDRMNAVKFRMLGWAMEE